MSEQFRTGANRPSAGLDPPAVELQVQIDQVCEDFVQAQRTGRQPRIEEFLERLPSAARRWLLPELIAEEAEHLRAAGQEVKADEYFARFDQDQAAVAQAFQLGGSALESTADFRRPDEDSAESDGSWPEPPLPEKIGRYAVLRRLGRGGFGMVYLATDPELQRDVALKVPRGDRFSSAADLELFLAEARTAARLNHPGIVSIHDVVREGGTVGVVQEYVAGQDLGQWLASQPQPVEPRQAARLMAEIAETIAYAHEESFVHRDLKPSNVLLDSAGRPRVADFGLAIHDSARRASAGERSGTPAYMSPEQVRGEWQQLDGRSDIWSLGVILYELLTGRRPFTGESRQQLFDEILDSEPKPPRQIDAQLPPPLERICLKALAKSPSDRYSTARDMAAELRAYLDSESAGPQAPQQSAPAASLLPGLLAASALAGLLIVGVFLASSGIPWRTGQQIGPGRAPAAQPSAPPSGVAEPLRIISLDIQHFALLNDAQVESRGIIGRDSFSAHLNDHVTMQAHLSRPAYAYLIAFRPDGELELCFPEDATQPPPLTDNPRYPSVTRGVDYGLNEGTGLWIFAIVASEGPLPPYRDWRAGQPSPPWQLVPATANTVFLDDGQWLDVLAPGGRTRGDRHKGVTAPERKSVTDLVDWLKQSAACTAVTALAFGVEPPPTHPSR